MISNLVNFVIVKFWMRAMATFSSNCHMNLNQFWAVIATWSLTPSPKIFLVLPLLKISRIGVPASNALAYQRGCCQDFRHGSVLVFKENIILFHVEGEQWESIQPPVVTLAPDERVGFGGLGQSVGALHYARRDSRVKFFASNQRLYILL